MKVLHLISEQPPIHSGFSRCIHHLSRELKKQGHEVAVVSTKHIRRWKFGEIKLVYDLPKIFQLNIKEYDIINIHGHTPTFSDSLLIAMKMKGAAPIVYTLHCLANFYVWPISKIYNQVMNKLIELADCIIVSTPSYAEYVRHAKNVYVVPWGVDYEFFHQPRKEHNGYNILFVGQMRPYKGIDILLKVAKELDAKFHIVGGGVYLKMYMKQAKKLQLSNVQFYGYLKDVELRNMYSQSDVLVLPSISTNEAFGLVALEAAAAGCVVVASDLPGVRDVVKPFGIIVPPGNLKALRETLMHFSMEENRVQYVEKGFKVAKKYSWSETGRKYDKVYKEVLERALTKGGCSPLR